MDYSGINFSLIPLSPPELEKMKKRARQELKINTMVVLPALTFVGVIVFYCNTVYKGQETMLEIINGIGGLAGGLLAWYYVRFLMNFKKDLKNGKKKSATGIVEGKRIVNAGKFNEKYCMLFQKNEFDLSSEIYAMVQKGFKIELQVTEHTERVLAIKKLV